MKTSRDPLRLTAAGSDAPPELQDALRAFAGTSGSPAQVESLARKLAPQLATPVFAGGAAGTSAIAKWLLGLAALGALGLAAIAYVDGAPPARPRPAPPHAQPAPAPLPAAQPVDAVAPPALAPPQAASRAARRPRAAPVAETPRATAAARSPEAELQLLQRSQAALDRDPAAALDLAEQHARDYPTGLFAQEREILAIEALLKLKHRAAAVRRAAEFVERHPESPHARRVRALLERSDPSLPAPTGAP